VANLERLSVPPIERQLDRLIGRVIYIDHFGNAITNITEADLRPFSKETLLVSIENVQITGIAATYAAVEIDAPVVIINGWGMVEIAVRNGSAAQRFVMQRGQPVQLIAI
jgi:S-adenosylmethionine hydrolase